MSVLDETHAADGRPDVPPLLLRQASDPATIRSALSLLDGVQEAVGPAQEGDGYVLVLVDPAAERDEPPTATALLFPVGPDVIELRALAVRAELPAAAVADRLLAGIADCLRAEGWRRVVASRRSNTSPAVISALSAAGYQTTDGELQEFLL